MNPDTSNIHPQIRIYVQYTLADPRRSAGSGWIWIRILRCSSRGAQRGVRIFRPSDRWIHHLWKEDPTPGPSFLPEHANLGWNHGPGSGPCAAPSRGRSVGFGFQDPQMAGSATFGRKILTLRTWRHLLIVL